MTNYTDGYQALAVTPDQPSRDTDVDHVIEILQGATRGDRNPDVALTIILAGLHAATADALQSALAVLLKHADLD